MHRCLWLGLLIITTCASGIASVELPAPPLRRAVLSERERQLRESLKRAAEYSDLPHVSMRSRCEDTRPPQALTTPDPFLIPGDAGTRVKVSFIIGADGRVRAPLILQSGGPAGDRNVLQTVRAWRYRPATCNGVPTEAEGKIEFSHR